MRAKHNLLCLPRQADTLQSGGFLRHPPAQPISSTQQKAAGYPHLFGVNRYGITPAAPEEQIIRQIWHDTVSASVI